MSPPLIERLPPIKGSYRVDAPLGQNTWFQVGGTADVLFKPEDAHDLASFLHRCPADVPLTILSVGSNILVRDGGIDGVVIRLGRAFTTITVSDDIVTAGAAALDLHVATVAQKHGRGGLEFLSGIPGTIGGAVKMNAGAYGREIRDTLMDATIVTRAGEIRVLTNTDLGFSYRTAALPEGSVVLSARLRTTADAPDAIAQRMQKIQDDRAASQPIRSRTGGSTFRNPDGHKAWELIDRAGCRGLRVGGAQVSEKHCNFLINTGDATAADLENLGELVRARVYDTTGIRLEWEIIRLGRHKK